MSTEIKCPNCGHGFEPTDSIREEVQRELRIKMTDWQKTQHQKLEAQLIEEKKRVQQETEAMVRTSLMYDFESKLDLLTKTNKENEEKLRLARQNETELLRKEQELKNKEAELELNIQRQLQKEREKLSVELRKIEEEKIAAKENEWTLRNKELEKQLVDARKVADEWRRKVDQGSSQLHGEVQELALEAILRTSFPFDEVIEVRKGVEGADCLLVVKNNKGAECGKIIFESKRVKGWNNTWLDKLKNDMRSKQADLAILVSNVFPKGMNCFGEKDGIWIAAFSEVVSLTMALRNAIIRISEIKGTEEHKGEKMHLLYDYLTGIEFRQNIEAIVEGFISMKNSITRERVQMEKIWKEREKQLDKVLFSTSGMYGSIKGIAGSSVQHIPLLESANEIENI